MTLGTPFKLLPESHLGLRTSNSCKHLRSVSSKEFKAPKVIKSSSSSEISKLASLRTPKKGSYKNDDESDDSKSNASSKKQTCSSSLPY
jgi:hypothetical protein